MPIKKCCPKLGHFHSSLGMKVAFLHNKWWFKKWLILVYRFWWWLEKWLNLAEEWRVFGFLFWQHWVSWQEKVLGEGLQSEKPSIGVNVPKYLHATGVGHLLFVRLGTQITRAFRDCHKWSPFCGTGFSQKVKVMVGGGFIQKVIVMGKVSH